MGNFPGHALPGSFFIAFSLWHILMISIRYFQSLQRNGRPFKSTTYYPSPWCWKGAPVESFLKVFCCSVGILGEFVTGFNSYWVFVNFGNLQHITMFFFFGVVGATEILHHYKFHLPPNATYMLSMMAFVIEGLLFYFHLHGRDPMDVQIHQLLNTTIILTVGALSVEMARRKSVLPAICRTFLILLQGLWFWQAAFILYPPEGWEPWDLKNHEEMMVVTVIFAAHVAFSLFVTLAIWFCVSCCYGSCRIEPSNKERGYSTLGMEVLHGKRSSQNGSRIQESSQLVEDAEDELEGSDEELFSVP